MPTGTQCYIYPVVEVEIDMGGGKIQVEAAVSDTLPMWGLLGVDRCGLSWGSGRGLLEIYWGWKDAASAGDQEEVY